MKTIAYKRSFNQYVNFFLSGISAILSILFFVWKTYIWAFAMLALFVFFVIMAIYCLRQPDELIKLNNDTLEIYCKKETKLIPLTDILKVNWRTSDQFASFSYGYLDIVTTKEHIKIYNVSDLHNVAMKISELKAVANQNKTAADNSDI